MGDRVVINVSGRRYETMLSTLHRLPQSSLLGDEQRRAPYWDAARGEFFFDRSASSFEGVLLVYQTGGEVRPPPAGVSERTFLEDLRFFGLSEQAEQLSGGGAAPTRAPPPVGWRSRAGALVRGPALAVLSALVTLLSVLVYVFATLPSLDYERRHSFADDRLETIDDAGSHNTLAALFVVEVLCVVFILLEVIARLVTSSRVVRTLRDPLNILDLVSVLLFIVTFITALGVVALLARLVRLVRVFRFVRMTSSGRALLRAAAAAAPAFGVILMLWVAAALFFATLLYWLQDRTAYTYMRSMLEALYMVVITMTTVGYGDMYPRDTASRVVGCLCAYTGCLLLALPAAVVVVKFAQCTTGEGKKGGGGKGKEAEGVALSCTRK